VFFVICLVFSLLIGTNVVWFQKSIAEKKLLETDRRVSDLMGQLEAERLKRATLEMKIKSMSAEATLSANATPKPFKYPQPHEAKNNPHHHPPLHPKHPPPPPATDEPPPRKMEAQRTEPPPAPPPAKAQTPVAAAPAGVGGAGSGQGKHCTVPVVVMACNRPGYLERTLKALQQRMPGSLPAGVGGGTVSFEIVVSQDGTMQGVSDLMKNKFSDIRFMQHVDDTPLTKQNPGEQDSYYRIARHYGWALDKLLGGGGGRLGHHPRGRPGGIPRLLPLHGGWRGPAEAGPHAVDRDRVERQRAPPLGQGP